MKLPLHTLLWVIGITGGLASIFAWRVDAAQRSRAFRWGGCALLAGLLLLLRYKTKTLVRADLPAVLAACIWWLPFFAWFFFLCLGRRRTPRLVDAAKTSSPFRGAEAAAKRKDYPEAILLYHQAALDYPEDPDPRRCIAEMFLESGMPDDAIVSFRDAQKLLSEPADQMLMVFAIAETLVEYKKDVPAAIQVVENFLAEHPDVEGRRYAEKRLQKMRARLAKESAVTA